MSLSDEEPRLLQLAYVWLRPVDNAHVWDADDIRARLAVDNATVATAGQLNLQGHQVQGSYWRSPQARTETPHAGPLLDAALQPIRQQRQAFERVRAAYGLRAGLAHVVEMTAVFAQDDPRAEPTLDVLRPDLTLSVGLIRELAALGLEYSLDEYLFT